MQKDSQSVLVSIACPNQEAAMKLGKKLVAEKLVACAQLFPIHSIYRWKGKVESDPEVMLQAKTMSKKLEALERLVLEIHEYEVPEIIATPILWGHQAYLDWMKEQTTLNDGGVS